LGEKRFYPLAAVFGGGFHTGVLTYFSRIIFPQGAGVLFSSFIRRRPLRGLFFFRGGTQGAGGEEDKIGGVAVGFR